MSDPTAQDIRWAKIQQTRERDPQTGEPVPGSFGRSYFRWHNNIVDRVLVMMRTGIDTARVQRMHGSQMIEVPIDSLRTEVEIYDFIAAKHRKHLPTEAQIKQGNWNPNTLPVAIVMEIWGS